MGLIGVLQSVMNMKKKLDVSKLPSQGYFYASDFEVRIRKANYEDIVNYELNLENATVIGTISEIKKIVKNNTSYSKGYSFEDIRSVDIVYIFLEIVKLTTSNPIIVDYLDDIYGHSIHLEFDSSSFNYFDFSKFEKFYDRETLSFIIDGYRFCMPKIGIEDCLTEFIFDAKYKNMEEISFDFIFFLGDKKSLSTSEIDNLIQIFNYEMKQSEKQKIKSIVNSFIDMIGYTLKINGNIVDLKYKINLTNIWREND
jgi:hypothetical protein